MSLKDNASLLRSSKRLKRQGGSLKPTRESEYEEDTKHFPTVLAKCYEEFSVAEFPIIKEYVIHAHDQIALLDFQENLIEYIDIRTFCEVYYEPDRCSVRKLACLFPKITSNALLALNKAISSCLSLSSLDLNYCNLTSKHLLILKNGIKNLKTITDLSLKGNPNEEQNFELFVNMGLKSLCLKFCEINKNGLRRLSNEFLNVSPGVSLIHLDLSSNMVFNEGCEYIADILRCDRCLLSLNLSDCKISDEGIEEILNCFHPFQLKKKEILQRRRIRFEYYKKIQSYGSCHKDIEEQIEKHPFVCDVTVENGELLCKGNNVLKNLNLAYNHISKDGLQSILKVLMAQMSVDISLKRIGTEGNDQKDHQHINKAIEEVLGGKLLGKSEESVRSSRRRKSSSRNSQINNI